MTGVSLPSVQIPDSCYRPVAMLTFALNHVASGAFSAVNLKATNLAIHLLLGALVYLFARTVLLAPALRTHRLDAASSGSWL